MTFLDPELEARLVDPETREPLHRASPDELAALQAAIAGGRVRRADDGPLPERIDGAYLDPSGRRAYPVVDGIPTFLVDERLEPVA